jgi:uncharacterized protein YbaP (TraB family)
VGKQVELIEPVNDLVATGALHLPGLDELSQAVG